MITASPATSSTNSLSVNGTSAYVQVSNSTSLNITGAITVEAWIKVNSIGAYQDIITRESYGQAGTGGGYELSVTNVGKVRFDTFQGPTSWTPVIGSTTISTGVWHHVAGVWNGTQMSIYLNGVLDGSVNTGNGPASGTSSLKIGRTSVGSYFNGLIDEAKVSNTAVYTSNFSPQMHLTATANTKGLWKFDGQSAADSSTNGNNGTLQGGALYSNDVPTGPAYHSLSVNGTSAYVQVPNSSSLNITGSITVEASIKVNSIGAYQDIISRESYGQSGTGGGYELSVTNVGKVRFDTYQGPTSWTPVIGGTTISTGVWYHVAGVWDGTQMRIYLNGVLDGSVSTSNGPASGTSSLKIGRTSGASYFNGLIDEAKVSNAAVYSSNFTPQTHLSATAITKGLWKFDGQVATDASTNGNNGTLQGGATYSNDVPSGDGGGGGGSGTPAQTLWLVADHLGTPRIIVDQTGSLAGVKRHDYLPFGEELFAGTGGRTAPMGYSADGVRQQFTQKERDAETGLDYFGARYYASSQGRFLSPDPLNPLLSRSNDTQGETLFLRYITEPANWNKYSYVYNNPLRRIDPDGRFPQDLVPRPDVVTTITRYTRSSQIALQLAIKITKATLDWVFGGTPEVRPGALQQHEVAFAKQVSEFTQFSFVGMPTKNEPGIDGILTGSGGLTDVRGVASLTETQRDNPRVLIDLAKDKELSAKNGGYKQVDLFIKAKALDSGTVTDYVKRGPAITDVASGGTIRSISIFTSDNKVVRVEGQKVTTCDQSGSCQ